MTFDFEAFKRRVAGTLPDHIGVEVITLDATEVVAELGVAKQVMAPNGFLHAGALVTLADTCCGYGCAANLPPGANGFTTIELKSNHLGTLREGRVRCVARPVHTGRTTQVWDATVSDAATGKALVLFRCTQMVLYPKS